jgi:hypothetical protein
MKRLTMINKSVIKSENSSGSQLSYSKKGGRTSVFEQSDRIEEKRT